MIIMKYCNKQNESIGEYFAIYDSATQTGSS